jgi:hypothetical protein
MALERSAAAKALASAEIPNQRSSSGHGLFSRR